MGATDKHVQRDLARVSALAVLTWPFAVESHERAHLPFFNPFWLFCTALFFINIRFLIPKGGSTLSRLIMRAFVGTWAAIASTSYLAPIIKKHGLLDRVRTQNSDGTWHESWRVLTFPHMPTSR